MAIKSQATFAPSFGSLETSTVVLAGLETSKYSAYTLLTLLKSFMFFLIFNIFHKKFQFIYYTVKYRVTFNTL